MSVALVAPAALITTFVTSIIGTLTFAALSWLTSAQTSPNWPVGIACGLGGLLGGTLGATLAPRLPERALTCLLGVTAISVGGFYLVAGLAG